MNEVMNEKKNQKIKKKPKKRFHADGNITKLTDVPTTGNQR